MFYISSIVIGQSDGCFISVRCQYSIACNTGIGEVVDDEHVLLACFYFILHNVIALSAWWCSSLEEVSWAVLQEHVVEHIVFWAALWDLSAVLVIESEDDILING